MRKIGCSFALRCHAATAACTATLPPAQHFGAGRLARCIHLPQEGAPWRPYRRDAVSWHREKTHLGP